MREVTEVKELPAPRTKWNWDQLLNGKIWELDMDDLEKAHTNNFDNNFRTLMHHHAKKRGLQVSYRAIEKDTRGNTTKVWMQARVKN